MPSKRIRKDKTDIISNETFRFDSFHVQKIHSQFQRTQIISDPMQATVSDEKSCLSNRREKSLIRNSE